ncbi:MAG: hypothetical protein JRI68_28080 [Deltaproteobacteria bacterium]|nr:hypothetical protein [Deltaproteobacteria bacterium]
MDDEETVRIKVTKEQAAKLVSQVPLPRLPFDSDGPTLTKAQPISDADEEEPVPPTVASTPDPVLPAAPQSAEPPAASAAPQPSSGAYDPASLELVSAPGKRRFPLGLVLLIVAALAVVLLFALTQASG